MSDVHRGFSKKQNVGIWNAWNFIMEDLTLFIINRGHNRTGEHMLARSRQLLQISYHGATRRNWKELYCLVYFLFLWLKNNDDYWHEATRGLAVFQSSQSHYYILTCSTCGDRVTLSAPQHFSFVVPRYLFFLFIYIICARFFL